MTGTNDRDNPDPSDDTPVEVVAKDALLKLHKVPRKPPTEAEAKVVRGGGREVPERYFSKP